MVACQSSRETMHKLEFSLNWEKLHPGSFIKQGVNSLHPSITSKDSFLRAMSKVKKQFFMVKEVLNSRIFGVVGFKKS